MDETKDNEVVVENIDETSVEHEETNVITEEEVEVDETVETTVDEKTYTQADIDLLQAQIDELSQYKPKELTEDEIKIQQKLESIWQREVSQTLKEEGLEIFADFIKADVDDNESLKSQITKLKEIVGSLEISNGYQPSNHKPVDGYTIAKKNKNVNDMIKSKLKF